MTRTQTTLAGLLVVQFALILLLRSPFSGAASEIGLRPLLPELDAFTPSRVQVEGGDEMLTLARHGNDWTLEELGGYPARSDGVDELLADLGGLQVRQPLVSSDRYHAALEIGDDEPRGRLRVWGDGDETPSIELLVGSSPNYRTTHVRLADDDAVYEVRGLNSSDISARAGSWIDKEFVAVDPNEVYELVLANAEGRFELVKREGAWQVRAPASHAGRALAADKLDSLLRSATSIRIADPVGPVDEQAQGFAEAAATVTLRWSAMADALGPGESPGDEVEGGQIVVRIGGKLPENESQRYVSRSDFGYAASLWDSSASSLLEQKLDDLLES